MVLVQNYGLAVFLCAVAMICWGSWQNTQNLIGKEWRFEQSAAFHLSAASPAISYGLGNSAPVVAALWGIFVWKVFKGASKGTNSLLILMFGFYLAGLVSIVYSRFA